MHIINNIKSSIAETIESVGRQKQESMRKKEIPGHFTRPSEKSFVILNPKTKPSSEITPLEIENSWHNEIHLPQDELMLRNFFEIIAEPMIVVDNNLSVRMLNKAAMEYYKIKDREKIIGQICHKALRGREEPCAECEVLHSIKTGKPRIFERAGLFDQERIETLTVHTIKGKNENITGAILHLRDVTEQKIFEKHLIQSEKLATLGVLVSSIAHEINNPNNFISFNAPILREYFEELMPIVDAYADENPDFELFHMSYPEFREDLFKLLDNIQHGSARINSVVSHLKEFSWRKDKHELKWINLKSVIEKSLAMCEVKMRKTVKSFVKNVPFELQDIYSDPYALEQIIINLLVNAAQASDKEDSIVELSVEVGNSWPEKTIIKVSDNGRGMDSKTLERLFIPFFTSKNRSEGTGLGLYITNTLIESLGGRIEVKSEAGVGSVFRVILPDRERRKIKRETGVAEMNDKRRIRPIWTTA